VTEQEWLAIVDRNIGDRHATVMCGSIKCNVCPFIHDCGLRTASIDKFVLRKYRKLTAGKLEELFS
jgi:hypothetical protein